MCRIILKHPEYTKRSLGSDKCDLTQYIMHTFEFFHAQFKTLYSYTIMSTIYFVW